MYRSIPVVDITITFMTNDKYDHIRDRQKNTVHQQLQNRIYYEVKKKLGSDLFKQMSLFDNTLTRENLR